MKITLKTTAMRTLVLPTLDTSSYAKTGLEASSTVVEPSSTVFAPTLPSRPQTAECEKRYSLWNFCLGICVGRS